MKKLNKVASLFATAALAGSMSGVSAQTVDNWVNGNGNLPWKNGTDELCWRDGYWTPATAIAECDGALKPPAPVPPP
ncbi:MAG TPA: OmpA family protein, partial [Burkholderiaceae bacterium]|nr:OmpA family protein [Burkholderiaceae bacterium]